MVTLERANHVGLFKKDQPRSESGKEYLSAEETGSLLKISVPQLLRLVQHGKIPSHQVNGECCFKRSDVEAYFAGKQFDATTVITGPMERRDAERSECYLECAFGTVATRFNEIIGRGIIKNISTSGILLSPEVVADIAGAFEPNMTIHLSFKIKNFISLQKTIELDGRIIRLIPRKKQAPDLGIQFSELPHATREKIEAFVG